MIRAAIAGGTGYTGGELLRILLNHPMVRVTDVLSSSADGIPVADIHRDLIGETDLKFGTEMHDPDVLFLCLGHSLSREFIHSHNIGKDCRIFPSRGGLRGAAFRLRTHGSGKGGYPASRQHSQSRLLRNGHTAGTAALGLCRTPQRRGPCKCCHRLYRSREKACRKRPLQLQGQQPVHLQAVLPPAPGRNTETSRPHIRK